MRSSFSVRRLESDYDPVFLVSPLSGIVEPGASTQISVQFTALTSGMFSSDTFQINTPGGNRMQVKCTGTTIGAKVSPSIISINFGSIPVGTLVSKTLTLYHQGQSCMLIMKNKQQLRSCQHSISNRCKRSV